MSQPKDHKEGRHVALQPDDHKILRLLREDFLLLTSDQIKQFFSHRSLKAIRKRLQKLVRAGLVSSRSAVPPDLPLLYPHYYLGPRAVETAPEPANQQGLLRRIKRARHFSVSALPHLALLNRVHIKFALAHTEYPDYALTNWRNFDDPFWANFDTDGAGLRPDGYVEIVKAGVRFSYFIEADRGTYRGEHLRHKLSTYSMYAGYGEKPQQFRFHHPRFRVLFVTTHPLRLRQLAKAASHYHPDLFWIATLSDFSQNSLFHAHWKDAPRGRTHALDEPFGSDPPDPPDINET